MSSDVVIAVENLSKCYQIYDQPRDRLKQFIYPRIQHALRLPVKQYYREFWALHDVSFTIKKGETLGVVGRNGSGKSTLLQMICGTLNPTHGQVHTQGRIAALLELGSGFNLEFTGRENVYMNATLLGLNTHEVDERFDDIVAFADIGDFVDQPVKTYSSGMFVRLAFAVIAHVDADILVIDEALAVGDVFFTQKCMRFLRDFMETGTVLFVSHDTASVKNLCNSALWLDKGNAIQYGAPKDICESYLQVMYEEQQGTSRSAQHATPVPRSQPAQTKRYDQRQQFLNCSNLRNDLQIFEFDPEATSFGLNGAKIISVEILNDKGDPLAWAIGGEVVTISIKAHAYEELDSPIIGFVVKDRLGQTLFGENTYLSFIDAPVSTQAGKTLQADFTFTMPILPVGDYAINVALANGTQEHHVQHHWIHDAVAFKSEATSASAGLVGIPMLHIDMQTESSVSPSAPSGTDS
ncbi:ABC transporter ATP-binding protein [Desulfovibrio inopinatus]|uniref:ABC transporter ATP-binding protein n=1 Tax=Desulfovibrio inopinatus TaxID=102109 RepID=UPI0004037C84|nr:ABC transporter ATP-binding protein [Desulfovibrio inopinatus]